MLSMNPTVSNDAIPIPSLMRFLSKKSSDSLAIESSPAPMP